MSSRSIETEQELCETYLKRWQHILYMGNWRMEVFVKPREVWTNPNDAYTLWDIDGRVAKIYILYSADWRGPRENELSWSYNLELLVLHEMFHNFIGEFLYVIPDHKDNNEEGLVNKLSILFYELYHKDDPTKGDYDK